MVYSHEHCFQLPLAIAKMVQIASVVANDVVVIGYCRSPSSFIQAAYCQWLFRSAVRAREVWEAVADLGLEPSLFTGLERHFIGAVATGFRTARQLSGRSIVDWRLNYSEIEAGIASPEATLSVGVLPLRGSKLSLLEDFYARCQLLDGLPSVFLETAVANRQYDLDLVEATQLAILDGRPLPGPHQDNDYFERATALLSDKMSDEGALVAVLKACADTMLWPSNRLLATQYGLDEAAFPPSNAVTVEQAINTVREEQSRRLASPEGVIARQSRMISRLAGLGHALFHQAADQI